MEMLAIALILPGIFSDYRFPGDLSPVQVSELAAFPVVLMAGRVLMREKERFLSRRALAGVLAVTGLPVTLLLLMPGDTIVAAYIMMTLMALLAVGMRKWGWALLATAVVTASLFAALQGPLRPYSGHPPVFVTPQPDFSKAECAVKGMVAASNGGLLGKGYGKGDFSACCGFEDLRNEFIIASFAEEFGFLGVTLAISLFAMLTFICLQAASKANAKPERFVAAAMGCFIGCHVLLHAGAVALLVPANGFPLPLFSSGPATAAFVAMFAGMLSRTLIRPGALLSK
jgi:rod shape determining protein RodA